MPDAQAPHLRLAGVTRLSLSGGRGPKDAFIFDPHRLALPCWALALEGGPPALLVTLDRHFDLVPPERPAPPASSGLRALDEYARWELDVRNYDHILASMEAGLLSDALVLARAKPRGAVEAEAWTDRRGVTHRLLGATSVDRVSEDFGQPSAAPKVAQAAELIARAERVLLDVDLDCFTTVSDADPTAVVPWPKTLIREYLLPPGSEGFWRAVLERCVALTFAREPHHCGGLLASAELFAEVSDVLFGELLGTEPP
jgi:hypothetical protein